jgi:hypothetical protein
MGYGEDALSHILQRDYDVSVSHHGVGNVLKRAGLLEKRKKKVRKTRQLSNREYYPGEVGQMDVKHWKRSGYQYDIIDCATRIKYKRIYPGWDPQTTMFTPSGLFLFVLRWRVMNRFSGGHWRRLAESILAIRALQLLHPAC